MWEFCLSARKSVAAGTVALLEYAEGPVGPVCPMHSVKVFAEKNIAHGKTVNSFTLHCKRDMCFVLNIKISQGRLLAKVCTVCTCDHLFLNGMLRMV